MLRVRPPRVSALCRRRPRAGIHRAHGIHTAVLAASGPARPHHFVDQIAPAAPHDAVVFLATPSFAPWLLDDAVFLEKALTKLYARPPNTVHAVCAVVDKLPRPRHARIKARATNPPVNETGDEGIAYAVLPSSACLPPPPPGDRAFIDFVAHTSSSPLHLHDRVRLPLANTVFQTGFPSTLIRSQWEAHNGRLRSVSRQNVETAAFNLSALPTGLALDVSALSIPLLPLTLPRRVDGHMGNIVRGLIGPGGRMTASTELEDVVPRYFTTRGQPAQATSAWALIIPKALITTNIANFDVESTWQGPPEFTTYVQRIISAGGRLHRVLSGGGGWGKKAGLLSLDPMPVGASPAEFDSDDFSAALRPVVQDGDFLQFFVSPLADASQDVGGSLWSWEFGVIPSTIDAVPRAVEEEVSVTAHKGTFGALTETGLTLMRGRSDETGVAENLSTTTIDVPFARWSALRCNASTLQQPDDAPNTIRGEHE